MKNQLSSIIAGLVLVLAGTVSQSHAVPTITAFTGGDAGEGFTLSGTYLYTVDLGGEDGWIPNQTVQGYTFIKATAAGVTVATTGTSLAAPWWQPTPSYGSSADDDALEQIMGNTQLVYGDSPSVSLTIPVTSGQQYSLQLLFSDNSETAARNFDVSIEGDLVADNFQPQQGVTPFTTPRTFGTVMTHTFTAGDDSLNILLSQGDWGIGDANPIIQGFTLQAISGPPTVPYADWASANGVAGDPDVDSDNDGVDNGVEYFMGITSADPVFTANPAMDSSNMIAWPMSATFNGTYEVETSTDLGTWTPVTPRPTPASGVITYTLPPGVPGGKNFVRLVVTPN
jgi:hypothetical protein